MAIVEAPLLQGLVHARFGRGKRAETGVLKHIQPHDGVAKVLVVLDARKAKQLAPRVLRQGGVHLLREPLKGKCAAAEWRRSARSTTKPMATSNSSAGEGDAGSPTWLAQNRTAAACEAAGSNA